MRRGGARFCTHKSPFGRLGASGVYNAHPRVSESISSVFNQALNVVRLNTKASGREL